jgi:hypothetical protein
MRNIAVLTTQSAGKQQTPKTRLPLADLRRQQCGAGIDGKITGVDDLPYCSKGTWG